ncbi:Regulator of nonsense transcripts 2 [Portunus trituberculatus]|uniref:Regulator of nonsense transcripts 2 n=1 Tax=Portunus trituberculatus TaxID=210409 RepID=A0A5B7CWA4_PORTR|nr:Regulator of nonsense transcripts 2 [Portunus trituberculatus]
MSQQGDGRVVTAAWVGGHSGCLPGDWCGSRSWRPSTWTSTLSQCCAAASALCGCKKSVAQRPATMNFNRDRRPKYQHPKGAPDADLIFGPKKIR